MYSEDVAHYLFRLYLPWVLTAIKLYRNRAAAGFHSAGSGRNLRSDARHIAYPVARHGINPGAAVFAIRRGSLMPPNTMADDGLAARIIASSRR